MALGLSPVRGIGPWGEKKEPVFALCFRAPSDTAGNRSQVVLLNRGPELPYAPCTPSDTSLISVFAPVDPNLDPAGRGRFRLPKRPQYH